MAAAIQLLCTDLDRTLLPNGEAQESALGRSILWRLLAMRNIRLGYVSGRDLDRVLGAIDHYQLQVPDVIVADVGSSIYFPDRDGWQLSTDWQQQIARAWNGVGAESIAAAVSQVGGLTAQEPSRQSEYKSSFYVDRSADWSLLRRAIHQALVDRGVDAALVFSDDPEKGVGLLDVLPATATKVDAIRFLQQREALSNEQVLFAGDSGNDVSALASAVCSVTVANADQPTREATQQQAASAGHAGSTYQAVGDLALVPGVRLNGNYAAGIVEGLMHFQPDLLAELRNDDWLAQAARQQATEAVSPMGKGA